MRLEYLLVPLVFGIGAPVASMVGTNIGASQNARAHCALPGPVLRSPAASPSAIGIAAALAPHLWLSLFGDDATMNAVGSQYLRIVGPFYGFFGVGLGALFRVARRRPGGMADGRGDPARHHRRGRRMARRARSAGGTAGVFAALAAALVLYGVLNVGRRRDRRMVPRRQNR